MNFFKSKSAALLYIAVMCTSLKAFSQKVSDESIKTNISPISNSVDQLRALQPQTFKYDLSKAKGLSLPAGLQYGFNTENLEHKIPALVKNQSYQLPSGKNNFTTTSFKTVDMTSLIPLLVAAIKDQQDEIDRLKNELRQFKSNASSAK